jgi:hypothetical protein
MREPTLHEVTDELGVVARFSCEASAVGDAFAVRVATPRLVLVGTEAAQVLVAIERETTGARAVELRSNDAVLRQAARAAGYRGGLRADLVRDDAPNPPVPATVAEWLPDVAVVERAASVPRRVTRFFATGLDRMVRIEGSRAGVSVAVVAPMGPETLLEPVAATVDTLLDLTARFGPAPVRVPPITFSLNGTGIAHGQVAGANAVAGIVLSPMYVDAGALGVIRRRRDREARSGPVGSPFRPTRPAPPRHFSVEKTVVHEVGHSVDQAERSGRLSDTVAARRALGRAVGVDSVELALRASWAGAPPEWAQAYERIVTDLSAYATTNCVELFAEAFVAWYLRDDTPIAAAMDEVLRQRYPQLP